MLVELHPTEPALGTDSLVRELRVGPLGRRLERLRAHEVGALRLTSPTGHVGEPMRTCPDARAEREVAEPGLLGELTGECLLVRLRWLDTSAGRRPLRLIGPIETHQQNAVGRIDDKRANCRAKAKTA